MLNVVLHKQPYKNFAEMKFNLELPKKVFKGDSLTETRGKQWAFFFSKLKNTSCSGTNCSLLIYNGAYRYYDTLRVTCVGFSGIKWQGCRLQPNETSPVSQVFRTMVENMNDSI